ncbi:hypothetical protein BDP81DRAFT_331787 [Colletotrichum phormii]|uniref:Uncharacterized protein n=1 Tax=Colletotrichum phormii TaxID=359342 RepID=A0AAI9ZFN5_9PEZI|nr:uncharacterized protein BDP81DRAFT_331787 [Colletotrichum phormii]KAK1623591.1 hypothetical protein BDP81DRAFT_331787 [Colletotrichum phormii]
MPSFFLFFVLVTFLCWPCLAVYVAKDQFKSWYPEFGPTFEAIVEGNCSAEYERYLTIPRENATIDWFTGGGNTNRLAQPVANCILGNTSEFIMSNMAAAAVVLGLMPTILATIGNSVEETSTLCVIGQRPLIALLVAAGSPAIHPIRSFEYMNPMKLVKSRRYRLRTKRSSVPLRRVALAIEFLAAIAAIINTYTLCNQLGVMVVSMLAPQLTYLEFLWSIIGISSHVSAAASVWARTRITRGMTRREYIKQVLLRQFTPIGDKDWTKAVIDEDETYFSMALSYFTSLLGTCHLIYGSMLFSSLVFISATDSLKIMARYMASAMVSRFILMYELFWLRDILGERKGLFPRNDSIELTQPTEVLEHGGKIYHRSTASSGAFET